MTNATYTFNNGRKSFVCSVTQANDGKISISLPMMDKYSSTMSDRFRAKKLGKKIVEDGFVNDAIIDIIKEDTASLITVLTAKTQELKKNYIERTKEYAKEVFAHATKLSKFSYEELVQRYGEVDKRYPTYGYKNIDGVNQHVKITKELNREGVKAFSYAKDLVRIGYPKYEQKEVRNAENHYTASIDKLASRLNAKGIVSNKPLEIKSALLGQNFDMTITQEGKKVKAWTIIASGEIQRPHYRFLIK